MSRQPLLSSCLLVTTLLTGAFGCREPRADPPIDGPARGAISTDSPLPPSALTTVVLEGVPFVEQRPDFCGEACVEMAARRLGQSYDQDAVFSVTGLDPALGRGAYTKELAAAVRALGFDPGPVWSKISAADPLPDLERAFAQVHADLARGVPSVLCMHYDEREGTTEHFRLIVGYDAATDEVVYHEPAEADGAYRRMKRARLFSLWPLKYEAKEWTLVSLPLAPAKLVAPPPEPGFTKASYAQHVMALREKLGKHGLKGYNIRVEEPFVVVGDDDPHTLARRAETVTWAVEHLEKDFFDKRPKRILDVYLFKDESSYEGGVLKLASDPPSTPYGFYSSRLGGLFMNISTGGGTLVHEIVHPYVEADFPEAPAWLNEGLGSLFEQSAERGGHIVGLTNWRLAGLKKAIKQDRLPSFQQLTAMSDHSFYDEDRGDNYAQSRYLLYYLQEQGQLVPFYQAFRAAKAKDPTGYATLVATLGESDMAAFQERWQKWVLTLQYP